jgi:bifunctional non-homologous end joining protein LigD
MTTNDLPRKIGSVFISHPTKEIFPAQGITKWEIAEYYHAVYKVIFPYLEGRPLSFIRCPSGVEENCFVQKHPGAWLAKEVPRVTLPEVEGQGEYIFVENEEHLLALVQANIVEMHAWTSRLPDIDHPDQMVFDLDPDETVGSPQVVKMALALRDLLLEFELESFPRVTGGKGMHLVVPIARIHSWQEVNTCAFSLASRLVDLFPEDLTVNPLKQQRRGKIFVDYLRNSRGATCVVNYSLRVKPHATVAMPLSWSEVSPRLQMNGFSLASAKRCIDAGLTDPWEGFRELQQRLPAQEIPPIFDTGVQRNL